MAPAPAVADATSHLRPVESAPKPELQLVGRRRRWPFFAAGFIVLLVLAAMLGAAIFHTQLAERQLEIDALSTQVREEREHFNELRLKVSGLRSPERLAVEAKRLNMVQAPRSAYLEVDKWKMAQQLAAAGPVGDGVGQVIVDEGLLDQFLEIKASSAGQP